MRHSLKHRVRLLGLKLVRFVRSDARSRAADARKRNVVVGVTFGYHVVSKPGDAGPRDS